MSGKIYAPNQTTEISGDPSNPSNKYGDITGTTVMVGAEPKKALDVNTVRGAENEAAASLLQHFLAGTPPKCSWDEVGLSVSGSVYTYTFNFKDQKQMVVTVSNPLNAATVTAEGFDKVFLESYDNSTLRLEDDGLLLLEG